MNMMSNAVGAIALTATHYGNIQALQNAQGQSPRLRQIIQL
jgi:SLT domain-containing protein